MFRCTLVSSYHLPPQPAQRSRQKGAMQKYTAWRKFFLRRFVMPQYRFSSAYQVSCSCLTLLIFQAYIALCCSKEWKEEWKGVKLTRLYVLLREYFAYSDDPWCTETLGWWDEFRFNLSSTLGTHSPSFRKVFGSSSGSNEDTPEATRDTQGPTMRERMDIERQERMRVATGN